MKEWDETGIYQLKDGNWGFRYTVMVAGHRKDIRKTKTDNGKPYTSKMDAIKARLLALEKEKEAKPAVKPIARRTVKEVYAEYCEKGRSGKAFTTTKKQDSLWKNHLQAKFGKRFVDEITVADVMDFLSELYFKKRYSYRYVEGFLKMFYLIFGQAYSRNYLDVDTYNKLCVNKDTKIKMPKMKTDDDMDIIAFSQEELLLLDNYFKGTNAETAYLLGRYCGLRINECYGLKWDNVDLEKGTIRIDRQMQYQNGLIKLEPPKTKNANRTIYMCSYLKNYMVELYRKRQQYETELADLREQNRRTIQDLDGSKILSTDMVNCLPNGKIQTLNSFKFPSRELKARYHISFKYHYLRHTYGTLMAELNTPTHLLCNQMGHGKIQVTQKYYLAVSKTGIDILQNNLERL